MIPRCLFWLPVLFSASSSARTTTLKLGAMAPCQFAIHPIFQERRLLVFVLFPHLQLAWVGQRGCLCLLRPDFLEPCDRCLVLSGIKSKYCHIQQISKPFWEVFFKSDFSHEVEEHDAMMNLDEKDCYGIVPRAFPILQLGSWLVWEHITSKYGI